MLILILPILIFIAYLLMYVNYIKIKNKSLLLFERVTNNNFRTIKTLELYSPSALAEGFFEGEKVNISVGYLGNVVLGVYKHRTGWRKLLLGNWKTANVALDLKKVDESVIKIKDKYRLLINSCD